MTKNPYEVDGKPIIQFKLEARAWYDGYGACRKDDFEILNEMHKTLQEEQAVLRRLHNKYVELMARGVSENSGKGKETG